MKLIFLVSFLMCFINKVASDWTGLKVQLASLYGFTERLAQMLTHFYVTLKFLNVLKVWFVYLLLLLSFCFWSYSGSSSQISHVSKSVKKNLTVRLSMLTTFPGGLHSVSESPWTTIFVRYSSHLPFATSQGHSNSTARVAMSCSDCPIVFI